LAEPYILIRLQENLLKRNYFEIKKDISWQVDEYNKNHKKYSMYLEVYKTNQIPFNPFNTSLNSSSYYEALYSLPILQEKLNGLDESIKILQSKLDATIMDAWDDLNKSGDIYITKANEINPTYVDKTLKQKKIELEFSGTYWAKYAAIYDLLKGDEYIKIAQYLSRIYSRLGEANQDISVVKKEIDKCLEVEYLHDEELIKLREFRKQIESFSSMDSITVFIIKNQIDLIIKSYFKKAVDNYDDSLSNLPEFVEPRIKWIYVVSILTARYKKALDLMRSFNIPLINVSLRGHFEIKNTSRSTIKSVYLDENAMAIGIIDLNGKKIPLIQYYDLSNAEIADIKEQLCQKTFVQRLSPHGLNTAEQILNAYVSTSQASKEWSEIMKELEEWLIKTIAYAGVAPIPHQCDEKTFEAFRKIPILENVKYDIEDAVDKFLKNSNIQREDVQILKV
jgi:hypothetical protein